MHPSTQPHIVALAVATVAALAESQLTSALFAELLCAEQLDGLVTLDRNKEGARAADLKKIQAKTGSQRQPKRNPRRRTRGRVFTMIPRRSESSVAPGGELRRVANPDNETLFLATRIVNKLRTITTPHGWLKGLWFCSITSAKRRRSCLMATRSRT